MKTNDYNLQILHHDEVFATRELALTYLNDFYKPKSLVAEPVLTMYGDTRNPDIILAFGVSNASDAVPGSYYAIDITQVKEQIEGLDEKTDTNTNELENIAESLSEIINAAGFDVDNNKIKDKITYKPDASDDVIGSAITIAQAIDLISKYAQKNFADNSLSVEDTKSVRLVYAINPDGGKTLKAEVNISTDGDTDELAFNNNIIGIKNDGLYAASNLSYDDVRHELIFTTSGYKNGRFQDDAIIQRVNLGEHTKLVANNEEHTVKLTINEDTSTYTTTISADVQISSNEDNILEIKDGKLFGSKRAKDIKYGDSNVAAALTSQKNKLNEVETKVANASKSAHIEGGQTDTLETTVSTLADGGAKVTGNVRLGSANSIVVRNGGLEANITVDVNTSTNTLIVKIGNETITKTLPGVELFESAEYNDANEELVITFKTGNKLNIPIHGIIHTWATDNSASSPITLTKTVITGGEDKLSGNLKLRSTDNILGIENGNLYASEAAIDSKISNETTRATNAENTLRADITSLGNTLVSKIDEVNEDINDVKESVVTEKERALAAENEIKSVANHADEIAAEAKTLANDANSTVTAVSENLRETDTRLENLTNTVNTNKTEINDRITETNANVTTNTNVINRVISELAEEKSERTNSDTEIKGIINTVNDSIQSETQRAGAAEVALGNEINEVEEDLKHLIEDETTRAKAAEKANADDIVEIRTQITEGSAETLAQAKAYTDSSVLAEENARKVKDTELTNMISTLSTKVDTDIATAVRNASDDATEKANNAKLEANNYTDDKVSAEETRAKAAEQTNADAITSLTTEVNKKIEKVTVEKNSDLQYFIKVDDITIGEINIPKDQFFKGSSYDSENKIITLNFITNEGEQSVQLNVSDLVDTYTAGNGLSVTNNKFEIKLNNETEAYLTLNEDGIGIFGINAALATKANITDLDELSDKVNVINGNAALEGSFAKGDADTLASAKVYTDEKIEAVNVELAKKAEKVELVKGDTDLIYRLIVDGTEAGTINIPEDQFLKSVDYSAITKEITFVFNTSEGEKTTKINVSDLVDTYVAGNGIKLEDNKFSVVVNEDSESYLQLTTEGLKVVGIDAALATKANVTDVYTKTEIDNKGFITEHQDISNLATKASLKETDDKAVQNTSDIATLNSTVNDIKFVTSETDTVNITMDKQTGDEYRTLSADVKLKTIASSENANIIKKDGNGLYATVSFDYNKASNTITFNDGNGAKTFELNNYGILQDAMYESATKSIVLIVKKDDESTERITIPVSDLVNTWSVENKANSPIVLEKVEGENGDILSADVSILNDSHNLLTNQNGSLFVDGDSNKHIALWGTEQTTVQGVINILKERTDEIEEIKSDIADLEAENQDIRVAISTYQTDLNNQKERLTNAESNITSISDDLHDYSLEVESLKLHVDEFETKIEAALQSATNAENTVNQLKTQLGDLTNEKTVAERLAAIERVISELIDFGTYSSEGGE